MMSRRRRPLGPLRDAVGRRLVEPARDYARRANRVPDEELRRQALVRHHAVDLVVDVGANRGQFADAMRDAGYAGQIVSFEPSSVAFAELSIRASADASWDAHRLALGRSEGEAALNVAGNSVSSSLLDMEDRHLAAAPESAYIGEELVPVDTLDAVVGERISAARAPWLKVDTQGYELEVLHGAVRCLEHVQILEVELSLVPLYRGQPLWREILDWLDARGFAAIGLEPGFWDPNSGAVRQLDGLFTRVD
jgi:FkbM family methyltransferase